MGDNKPPLFELLNFVLGGYPEHGLAFLLLTGVANGVVAILIWRLVATECEDWLGLAAGGVWLLTLSHVSGTHINVRSFALVGICGALYAGRDRPFLRGLAIGTAGLFSQYAVLFIPVLAWDSVRELRTKQRVTRLFVFGSAGLLTLGLSFGLVGLIWGPRASLAGLYWSYGLPTGVTTTGFATAPDSYLTEPWVITDTLQWGGWILHTGGTLSPLLLIAGIRCWRVINRRSWSVYATGAATLLLPLLVRSYDAYWLTSLPLIIILSAIEIEGRLGDN